VAVARLIGLRRDQWQWCCCVFHACCCLHAMERMDTHSPTLAALSADSELQPELGCCWLYVIVPLFAASACVHVYQSQAPPDH
jgi:hypothetical protein